MHSGRINESFVNDPWVFIPFVGNPALASSSAGTMMMLKLCVCVKEKKEWRRRNIMQIFLIQF